MAGLEGMTPVRLAKLVDGFDPPTALCALRAGTHPADPGRRFRTPARNVDPDQVARRHEAAGVAVLLPGDVGYPSRLIGDPGAPSVLFALGDPSLLEGRPRVSIVGTRSATPYGRRVASDMAAALSSQGVSVISGLALGIDAAAHAGVVRAGGGAAPPLAVVGTGLDVVYPASNRHLWDEVARHGAVVAESPLGTVARPGVFPARNRIIAALSDVVVVVECHRRGGSLYTAEAAARRSIPVCAVPGSVRSPSSFGTNALLVDGCLPVRDATDVMVALDLVRSGDLPVHGMPIRTTAALPVAPHRAGPAGRPTRSADADRTPAELAVLASVEAQPTALETILLRTGLSIADVAAVCHGLVESGSLTSGPGWWSLV
jgi:DNA processing protein